MGQRNRHQEGVEPSWDDLRAGGVGIGAIPHLLAAAHPELVEIESFRSQTASLKIPAWLLAHPDLRASAAVKAVFGVVGDALAAHFPAKHDRRRKRR